VPEPSPPALEPPPPAPAVDSSLAPLAGPDKPVSSEPAPSDAGSFADVAPQDAPEAPVSEAAAMPVPLDQVETIAQRVVGQVSEKIVREIAWDVIPDLAEALIKREIDRLKDELQKL
jgi:hypothetical protein